MFIIRAYRLAHPNQLEDSPFTSLVHLQLSTAKLTRKDMDCLVLMQTLQHLDFGGCAIDVPAKSITKLFATLQRLPSLRALHMDQIHNHHFKAACFGDRYPDPFPNLHILSIRATSAGATLFLEHLPALSLRKFLWDVVPTVDDSPLCEGRYRPRPQCFDRGVWETLEECAHTSLVQLTLKLPEDVRMPQLMVNEERWHASLTALQTLSLYGPPSIPFTAFFNPCDLEELQTIHHDAFRWDSLIGVNHWLRKSCDVDTVRIGRVSPSVSHRGVQGLKHLEGDFATHFYRGVTRLIIQESFDPGPNLDGTPLTAEEVAELLLQCYPDLQWVIFRQPQQDGLHVTLPPAFRDLIGDTAEVIDLT